MISFNPKSLLSLARIHAHGQQMTELDKLLWPLTFIQLRRKDMNEFLEREIYVWRTETRAVLADLGMESSVDQVDRMLSSFDNGLLDYAKYQEMQSHLFDRIQDDLGRADFFMVPPHKRAYFVSARTQFGEPVNNAFPSAQQDIESASKCFAFGRHTAVVFHLMRVMEVGLRAMGKSLNDPALDPKRNPSWEAILRRCDDELKLPLKDRSQEWKANQQFFCDATANLRAVKDAWRNPTMHVERDYDEEQSLDVLNCVKGFMRQLGKHLQE